MTQELAENFGYQRRDGLLIAEVDADGPAARADLKSGYLLAGIDGQATPDLLSAAGLLAGKKKGDRAELTITVRRQRGAFASVDQGSVTVRVRCATSVSSVGLDGPSGFVSSTAPPQVTASVPSDPASGTLQAVASFGPLAAGQLRHRAGGGLRRVHPGRRSPPPHWVYAGE